MPHRTEPTCLTCPHHRPTQQDGVVECRFMPPQLTHVMAKGPTGDKQPQWYSTYPAVHANEPCGQHPSVKVAAEVISLIKRPRGK